MCLHNDKTEVAKLLKKQNKIFVGYKILKTRYLWSDSISQLTLEAPYYNTNYVSGINRAKVS